MDISTSLRISCPASLRGQGTARAIAPASASARPAEATRSRRLGQEVLGVVTGDLPAVDLALLWALRPAAIGHIGAAGREHAARRRIERGGQFAAQHDALSLGPA